MLAWTRIADHPLGLAGFALFLIFGYLAKIKQGGEQRRMSRFAFAAAAMALAGGIALDYVAVSRPADPPFRSSPPVPAPPMAAPEVRQRTTGPNSPAIQGVQGDVTVTAGPGSQKIEIRKKAEK